MKNECAGTQPPYVIHTKIQTECAARTECGSESEWAPLTLAFLWNEIRIINSRSYKVLPAPREGFVCVYARAIKIKNSYARALFFLHSSILLLPGRGRRRRQRGQKRPRSLSLLIHRKREKGPATSNFLTALRRSRIMEKHGARAEMRATCAGRIEKLSATFQTRSIIHKGVRRPEHRDGFNRHGNEGKGLCKWGKTTQARLDLLSMRPCKGFLLRKILIILNSEHLNNCVDFQFYLIYNFTDYEQMHLHLTHSWVFFLIFRFNLLIYVFMYIRQTSAFKLLYPQNNADVCEQDNLAPLIWQKCAWLGMNFMWKVCAARILFGQEVGRTCIYTLKALPRGFKGVEGKC